ncbi:hypothetical protein [Teichococcus coralli]|nr:hypothetical protein [Pseudoroseomonas coralli]
MKQGIAHMDYCVGEDRPLKVRLLALAVLILLGLLVAGLSFAMTLNLRLW